MVRSIRGSFQIVFDESTMLKYAVEGETEGETAAFVAPAYERRAKCDCPRGYGIHRTKMRN